MKNSIKMIALTFTAIALLPNLEAHKRCKSGHKNFVHSIAKKACKKHSHGTARRAAVTSVYRMAKKSCFARSRGSKHTVNSHGRSLKNRSHKQSYTHQTKRNTKK